MYVCIHLKVTGTIIKYGGYKTNYNGPQCPSGLPGLVCNQKLPPLCGFDLQEVTMLRACPKVTLAIIGNNVQGNFAWYCRSSSSETRMAQNR